MLKPISTCDHARLVLFAMLCIGGSFGFAAPFARPVLAQSRVQEISLDDAISLALHRGEEIDLARGQVESAEGNEEVARSGMLPQISASANYERTLKSQYSGLSSGPDTGAAASLSSLFKNLPFGRANAWTLALNASQNIFTGGRLTALNDAAKARKHAAEVDLTAAQAQLVLNVTQSYYNAILADTIVKISRDALAEAEEVYDQTELAYKVGEKAEFDALRAKVARDNQVPVALQSEDNRARSVLPPEAVLELFAGRFARAHHAHRRFRKRASR